MDDYTPLVKICNDCQKEKTLDQFNKHSYSKDGLKPVCRACQADYNRKYREMNGDAIREKKRESYDKEAQQKRNKRYAENPENQIKIKQRGKDWYATNKEQSLADSARRYRNNPIPARARAKQWVKNNPERAKVTIQRRKARKNNLPDTLTSVDWQRCLNYFGGCCAVCGRPPGLWHTLAMDHWIPLSSPDCPGTVPTNIIPLCHSKKDGEECCNNTKGARPPREWLIFRFGKRKASIILKRIEDYFSSVD